MPYLNKRGEYWYICKNTVESGKHKHKTLKALGKISDEEAKSKLEEWGVGYGKQRVLIEAKMDTLRAFKRSGIPYDVWDFKDRGEGGDKNFHGNTSPKVATQLLLMLTNIGGYVIDPMCGSGTVIDVCKRLGRICTAFDLNPVRHDCIEHDATKDWDLVEAQADLIFIHPPYWNLVVYGKKRNDLSTAATLGDFFRLLRDIFTNAYTNLKPGGYIAVQQGDVVQNGQFLPLCTKTFQVLEECKFYPHHEIIKIAHGEVSRKKSGMLVAEYVYQEQWKISHDRILVFRK